MKIVIIMDGGELTTNCPKCNNETLIQYTDYIYKYPMIWCDGCAGRFVIDCSIEDLDSIEESESIEELDYDYTSNHGKEFDLLMIKRVANSDCEDEFVKIYNKEHNTLFEEPDVLVDYMISSNVIDSPFDNKYYKLLFDCVGVELNSYNVEDISEIVPGFDTIHDGRYIYLEVIKDGILDTTFYWGC